MSTIRPGGSADRDRRPPEEPGTTDRPAARDAASAAAFGKLVQSARKGRYTLPQLSERSGLSVGLLSQIERGQGNPSLTTMMKLAGALDVPLGYFLLGLEDDPRVVVRRGERKRVTVATESASTLTYELLTPDLNRTFAMSVINLPAYWDNKGNPVHHPGEEAMHVLEGTLEIGVGGDAYHLEAGDTITFDSRMPHWMRNPGRGVSRILSTMAPPHV